jgi:hypothetical protein
VNYFDKVDAKVVMIRHDRSFHPGWEGTAEVKKKSFSVKTELDRSYPTIDEALDRLEAQLRGAFEHGQDALGKS